jgi:ATP-binding cassette subfamily B protein
VLSEALNGRITAGAMVMFYAAFVQGQAVMRSALSNAGQLFVNSLFLGDLFAFLALDTEAAPASRPRTLPASRLRRGIRFHNVDFRYPGSSRPALKDFSLEIPAGRTVAIVGPNGAGKSTVLKLLCRFYEQQSGVIVIDDEDIRTRTPSELRQSLSVLFQDPVRYSATVRESVALGDVASSRAGARIPAVVRAAGADEIVHRLPRHIDTLLGKEFDNGVELSGGEWQRVALARALLRDAPILLLDEPTSAMDSWAEIEWFDRLRRATAGRTIVIITHRFTTAMRADVIHVMDEGRVVESGSHQELLDLDGRYAYSWARQTGESTATIPTRAAAVR